MEGKNIQKQKNDLFRLLHNVIPGTRKAVVLEIRKDIGVLLEELPWEKPNLKSLGIREPGPEEMLILMKGMKEKFNL